MRPLFVDFSGDQAAWGIDDEFMFGPDILVAPVLEAGATSRAVYLPAGTKWTDAWTSESLAGGQRQRVAMGRAIVREPAAFLMDEPLCNLDAKLRVSMRAALNQLHERLGTTTVYVTHDQVEAMTLGDRVCVLRDGQLQQAGIPQVLFDAPVNLFVAGFIGSPAMNFVTADLVRDEGPAVSFAGFRLPVPASVVAAKPGLEGYFGEKVIVGIRPSDFEDGAFGDAAWPRISVTAGVTEGLGTEIHAIFTIDAPPVEHASIASAAGGYDEEDKTVAALVGGKSLWTARVSSRSAARPGAPLELAVDTSRLHFFDPPPASRSAASCPPACWPLLASPDPASANPLDTTLTIAVSQTGTCTSQISSRFLYGLRKDGYVPPDGWMPASPTILDDTSTYKAPWIS